MTVTTSGHLDHWEWQLAHDSAVHYEQVLVPAYVGGAARLVVERAALRPGESILDIGCGTGAAARAARDVVGPGSNIVGMDVNRYMLDVARTQGPDLDIREGDARQIPVRDHFFDVVLCSHTLQYIPERHRAAAEMHRVLVPGGRVSVGIWQSIEQVPYHHALAEAITDELGAEVAYPLTSSFALSSREELAEALDEVGFRDVDVQPGQFDISLGDLATFIPRHISSTPMVGAFRGAGGGAAAAVVEAVSHALDPKHTGQVVVPFRMWIGTARA
jgi:ubiquinone/menaquinone biosynthesis C-methylase UbiE